MPTRYSGTGKITVTYSDSRNQYKVRCLNDRKEPQSVYVGIPPASRLAVDSAEAYDQAAHAGLSFCVDEGFDPSGFEYNPEGTGWLIRRTRGGSGGQGSQGGGHRKMPRRHPGQVVPWSTLNKGRAYKRLVAAWKRQYRNRKMDPITLNSITNAIHSAGTALLAAGGTDEDVNRAMNEALQASGKSGMGVPV